MESVWTYESFIFYFFNSSVDTNGLPCIFNNLAISLLLFWYEVSDFFSRWNGFNVNDEQSFYKIITLENPSFEIL